MSNLAIVPRQGYSGIRTWIVLGVDAEETTKIKVEAIKTIAPGILVTPAANELGTYAYRFGCNLTHAGSGYKICGPFADMRKAKLVAAALGGVMDWNRDGHDDFRAVLADLKIAVGNSGRLADWLTCLQETEWS